ncbi:hypothetical protein [Streptomyces decoyicus]
MDASIAQIAARAGISKGSGMPQTSGIRA